MSVSLAFKQKVGARVKSLLESKFASAFPGLTLEQLRPIVMGLIQKESSFNSKALVNSGSADKSFVNSSAYTTALNTGNPVVYGNLVRASLDVYGLMQVRGSYLVRGGSTSGKCEIERIRPDLSLTLCVAPGAAVESVLLGDDNIDAAITAGLVILQGKYQSVPSIMKRTASGGYYYSKTNLSFPNRISAAVGAYLGLSGTDKYGSSAVTYAASITNGEAYRAANNYDPTAAYPVVVADADTRTASQKASGASTNSTSNGRVLPPGC
jgi:hypothetical protein